MTAEYGGYPPVIIHGEGRPACRNICEVIYAAARNAKLNRKQTELLLFYAKQSSGFHPSVKRTVEMTGISSRRLRDVRKNLQNINLIDYEYSNGYHFIFVNWLVIRGLAMLERPLDVGGNGHMYFKRMNQQVFTKHPRYYETEETEGKQLKYAIGKIPKETPEATRRWLTIIGNWTEKEYEFIADSLMRAENTSILSALNSGSGAEVVQEEFSGKAKAL